MRKILSVLLIMLITLSLAACGGGSSNDEAWPQRGLVEMLPEPDAKKVRIGYNLDDKFSADIEKANEADFVDYIAKCENAGFTVDADSDIDDYIAYNAEGYKVSLSFYDALESVSIRLDAPKVNGTFNWPTIGLSTLLPAPGTNVGTISIDSSSQFNAWIGETSVDDYKAYVNQCIEKGFNVDYSNGEKVFTADNADGVSLRLEYEGFNTMYISMYAPDDENEEDEVKEAEKPVEENEEVEDNAELVDGMRPEFKKALDSYEEFFDDYCEFMKKYAENPTDLGLIADYTKFLSQYTETMSKMEALDDGEMNDAETKYYIEVTGRITQKLLEVSTTMN